MSEADSTDTADTVVPERVRRAKLGEPIDDEADEEQAPRRYYRFRIGEHGETIVLDHITYIGRRPSAPRIVTDEESRLITVLSPRREVSGTHVELRQVGSSVVVTDMKSTNGTAVIAPGGEPRILRQGESVVATPGTVVDIGDGNVIEILPMRLLG
jgi:pSer/pThr/pTyr-binding forkhead associated (FHA) protein